MFDFLIDNVVVQFERILLTYASKTWDNKNVDIKFSAHTKGTASSASFLDIFLAFFDRLDFEAVSDSVVFSAVMLFYILAYNAL